MKDFWSEPPTYGELRHFVDFQAFATGRSGEGAATGVSMKIPARSNGRCSNNGRDRLNYSAAFAFHEDQAKLALITDAHGGQSDAAHAGVRAVSSERGGARMGCGGQSCVAALHINARDFSRQGQASEGDWPAAQKSY